MKTKCIAILIAFFMLIAHASAQPYSIRANRGLNLRTEPSLNASIAETIHSGTVLQVVGKFNRWLKIDRDGREVWLADWVNFSRVESGAPGGSQQPTAQVDNCCFVNRQCATNQEWTEGYWAFQRNECPSGQPAAPVSAPVSASADVDNCCFVDRLCSSDQEWLDGYWAFQYNQCAGPAQVSTKTPSGRLPVIEGSDEFTRHVAATLNLMKSKTPDWYNFVISGMDLIVEVPVPFVDGNVQECVAWANGRERRVRLETCWTWISSWATGIPEHDQLDTAVALAHEACHIHTHEDGIYFATQEDEEAKCREFGTGAYVPLALALQRDLTRGEIGFDRVSALRRITHSCSQGYRAELFCPTIELLQAG